MIDFAAALSQVQPTELDLTGLGQIEGWLTHEATDFTCRLLHLQRALNQARGALELGVFKGKYLALLATLHDEELPVVGVDGFLARLGEPLEPRWRAVAEQQIRDNVARVAGSERRVTLIGSLTRDVNIRELLKHCPGGYSFISVDAGHDAEDLVIDLHIATATAAPTAIIALDDVFNPIVPGVVEGVCRFFQQKPGCPFRPFAICGNKVFLSGTATQPTYLAFTKWLLSSGSDATYIRNSVAQEDKNKSANFVPRFLGSEVVTFVWG